MSKSRKKLWITFIHGGKNPFFWSFLSSPKKERKIKEIRAKIERKSIMSVLTER